MAVFTPVSLAQASGFLSAYDIGEVVELTAIAEGVENTNYRLDTTQGRFVLTLFEGRTDEASLPFCLGLTAHLAGRGFTCPTPIENRAGGWLGRASHVAQAGGSVCGGRVGGGSGAAGPGGGGAGKAG